MRKGYSRRNFLLASATTATASFVARGWNGRAEAQDISLPLKETADVSLKVNGQEHHLSIDRRTTLLDLLREKIGLTGSKKGCDHGQCGACTVIVDGRRINSCLSLAVMQDGKEVTSIEGLGSPENLHPMQAAFVRRDGYQCGYCTPGQICSAVAMLSEHKQGWPSHVTGELNGDISLTDNEIRERMSGNICRCAAYPNILAAIRDVEKGRAT